MNFNPTDSDPTDSNPGSRPLIDARTWAVKYAKDIINRTNDYPKGRPIILEMGYGPSGVPHIGTITEAVRTFMVAKVLRNLIDRQVLVFAFCDDVDGMRKVPGNVPNQEMLQNYLGIPLNKVPDPFMTSTSFAEHNIGEFEKLLNNFGYNTVSYNPTSHYSIKDVMDLVNEQGDDPIVVIKSGDLYRNGSFDSMLEKILYKHQSILDIILPTLGDERRKTYSPFMPFSKHTGRVLETGVIEYYPDHKSILVEENGEKYELEINGNSCKLQWKVDFGMHWAELAVDFEMSGKDIGIGTNPLARQVCEILGQVAPISPMYEMFLAGDGSKMSKTKGNGVSLNDMIKYTSPAVIRHFMYINPNSAKRLDIQKMPSYIDAFIKDLEKFSQSPDVENPIWYSEPHISNNMSSDMDSNASNTIKIVVPNITASLLLNLIQSLHPQNLKMLVDFLKQKIVNFNVLDEQITEAMYYFYTDHYSPPKFEDMPESCRKYLTDFIQYLSDDATGMQTKLYDLGNCAINDGNAKDLKSWFNMIYKSLFGQDEGPRLGTFFALYGIENSTNLIRKACKLL